MKTALLTALRRMELAEAAAPDLRRPDDVLLRVEAVGVCGSDIHYFRTGRIGSQVVDFPFRIGHEFGARVEAVGEAVENVEPGDRVAVDPAVSCGACEQCRRGRPHTCEQLLFMGCPGQLDGCLAEFVVVPAACCFPLQPETTPELAALVEPLSIAVYTVRRAAVPPGEPVAILGAGPIGLAVLLGLRAAGTDGPGPIYLSEPLAYRREAALAHGADAAADPRTADLAAAFPPLAAVFDCCGEQAALDDACRLLAPGGQLVVVGIPEVERVSFSPDLLRRNEITIKHIRRQNGCVQAAIDILESASVDPRFLITHRFPLDRTQEAFDLVEAYTDGVLKAFVIPWLGLTRTRRF